MIIKLKSDTGTLPLSQMPDGVVFKPLPKTAMQFLSTQLLFINQFCLLIILLRANSSEKSNPLKMSYVREAYEHIKEVNQRPKVRACYVPFSVFDCILLCLKDEHTEL